MNQQTNMSKRFWTESRQIKAKKSIPTFYKARDHEAV